MFYAEQVDLRSRSAMVRFLSEHARYYTMNSWNRMTSYAHKVKLYSLGLSQDESRRAFDVLETDYWYHLQLPIERFKESTDRRFTIGSNGRSSGYLVLYRTGPGGNGMAANGIDEERDWEHWDIESLRDRARLVSRFDAACDEIRAEFIRLVREFDVVEEIVMIPKTIHLLRAKPEVAHA